MQGVRTPLSTGILYEHPPEPPLLTWSVYLSTPLFQIPGSRKEVGIGERRRRVCGGKEGGGKKMGGWRGGGKEGGGMEGWRVDRGKESGGKEGESGYCKNEFGLIRDASFLLLPVADLEVCTPPPPPSFFASYMQTHRFPISNEHLAASSKYLYCASTSTATKIFDTWLLHCSFNIDTLPISSSTPFSPFA